MSALYGRLSLLSRLSRRSRYSFLLSLLSRFSLLSRLSRCPRFLCCFSCGLSSIVSSPLSSRSLSSRSSSSVSFTSFFWRGFKRRSSTVYSRSSFSSPLSMTTRTSCLSTLTDLTSPMIPSGVLTFSPTDGILLFRYSYVSCSYLRQHISLPHTPDILVGLSERFCSFAILMETGTKSAI